MKLWVDDLRPAPEGYVWAKSVRLAKYCIEQVENWRKKAPTLGIEPKWHIEVIDIDHDAGDYAKDGGDFIKLLDWLEETGRNYPIRIHTMNPVGAQNMRAIIQRNGWTEVFYD